MSAHRLVSRLLLLTYVAARTSLPASGFVTSSLLAPRARMASFEAKKGGGKGGGGKPSAEEIKRRRAEAAARKAAAAATNGGAAPDPPPKPPPPKKKERDPAAELEALRAFALADGVELVDIGTNLQTRGSYGAVADQVRGRGELRREGRSQA